MQEPNGFYYMRARYYDPSVSRFISEDPSGFEGGDVNLYAYCGDNPINRVDPSGLCGRRFDRSSIDRLYAPSWLNRTRNNVNWGTVGIGAGEAILGIGTIAGSLIAGTAATTSTGGIASAWAIISAGSGVSSGFSLFALGVGEIVNGFTGRRSVSLEAISDLPPN